MSGAQSAVVLDHTALLALGAGSHLMSRMVASAHQESGRYVYAPAICVASALAERPGLADHISALSAVEVIDLGYAGAATVGGLIAAGVDWRTAHAIDAARPTLEWPTGRPVVTALPDPYDGWGVPLITLS